MNPQHTVPTIKDGDLVLWESRPIIAYLVNKYGKDDHLYPNDPVKRALVDQRLYFDMGTLYQRFLEYYFPQIMEKTPADPEKYKKLQEAFGFLNEFLNGQKFAAGDDLTVADLSLMVTVSSLVDGGANRSLTKYPNVQRWYTDCKITIPEYEKSNPGLDALRPYFVDLPAPVEDWYPIELIS